MQKAVKSGCKGARIVAGNGHCNYESVEKYGLGRFLKTWVLQVSVCQSLVEDFSVLDTWISERKANLGEFLQQQK